ncbi:aspartate aminotransferase family protein [Rhodococcus wratislaviensis]|uniref:aspartate aminotransferase family protein n=1 Tax=Rhodococcus wratislaviensis TaxID=44752 RepID=UPI00365C1761
MSTIDQVPMTTDVQASTRRHLWMHFSDLTSFADREIPTIVRGEGTYVFDDKGKRYIDGLAGLYTVNVGHGRTEIADAVHRQMTELAYYPVWGFTTPPAAALAQKISELTPGDLNRVFFTSGGSESVESAWKLACQYHGLRGKPSKVKIIARSGAYHGSTLGALAVTGVAPFRAPFLPLLGNALHAPAVNNYHAEVSARQHALDCANAVGAIIEAEGPDSVAAVIVEPVQSAGGCLVADPVYFARLREICDANDVLLISDETVCAWGRLGSFFGSAKIGYQPDIITTAKGMTSAYVPMGAVIASDQIAEPFLHEGVIFEHGLTFGGHPTAATAALANIAIIENEGLCDRAVSMGRTLREGLEELYRFPIVGDVRGDGLFYAIELVADRSTKEGLPSAVLAEWAKWVPGALLERGLICRAINRGGPTLQFSPPLTLNENDVDEIVNIVGSVLEVMSSQLV